jgi:integrase/recombinase XerC
VRAYVATAHRLIRFIGGHFGERVDAAILSGLKASDLRAYLAVRRGEGLGNSSAARELSAVRGFLAFAAVQDRRNGALPRVKAPSAPAACRARSRLPK